MEGIAPIYALILGNSPMFIAAIMGIGLAAVLWPSARTPALLMLLACALQVLITLANAAMYGWYLPHATAQGTMASVRDVLMIWSVVGSLLHAIAFGLLIWAAFAGRKQVPAASR
jgi:hypothetical protein